MCGIICCICDESCNKPSIDKRLFELLQNRGPNNHAVNLRDNILLGGFVLWQQGKHAALQPLVNENWTLLMNGDIFNLNTQDDSDTKWLVDRLPRCLNDNEILDLLKTLKGPYSIILYDSNSNNIYFARDPLGRNSLLIESNSPTSLKIMSNSFLDPSDENKTCLELPPLGLFKIYANIPKVALLYPWSSHNEKNIHTGLESIKAILEVEVQRQCIDPLWLMPSNANNNYFDFYQLCSLKTDSDTIYDHLLDDSDVNQSICEFLKLLRSSVKERACFTPSYCRICIEKLKAPCNHSKIAILFSGGIDCTILALLANEVVKGDDSIDLINVAFEASKAKAVIDWDVPDRCSAKESFEELKQLCPSRKWNFIEVNVTRQELNDELQSHIKHLIYPLNTILDESLGCAFWFAARAEGCCNGQSHKSTARVVLVGSGADELFGGYTRHRNAFTRCAGSHEDKLLSLSRELEMDLERLPSRNLGRDDRVIADNQKTSRAPFIQEDIMQFVKNLKPEQRCCFALEQGVGDKLFLRLTGYQLGLRNAIKLKKRAIQFGSRIANKNQNAKDLSINIQ